MGFIILFDLIATRFAGVWGVLLATTAIASAQSIASRKPITVHQVGVKSRRRAERANYKWAHRLVHSDLS
jgi:hypothetical protein